MTTIAIIEAVIISLAFLGFVRVFRNFTKIDNLRMKYKQKYQELECFEKSQYNEAACMTREWDYGKGSFYWLVSIHNASANRLLPLRRFDYDPTDENDKIYAKNCAQELCDMLNYDYSISTNKIENA